MNSQSEKEVNPTCLTNYVHSHAEPNVNKFLRYNRNSDATKDVKCLDSLVDEIEITSALFRGIDSPILSLEVGDIYQDNAYMSTSKDVDVAFGKFAQRNGSILLVIRGSSGYIKGIDVHKHIDDDTYEKEIILNRGTKMRVTSKTVYGNGYLFQENSEYAKSLMDMYPEISDVTVYEMTIVEDE